MMAYNKAEIYFKMSKYECVILSRDKIERFAVYIYEPYKWIQLSYIYAEQKKIHEKIKISQNTLK